MQTANSNSVGEKVRMVNWELQLIKPEIPVCIIIMTFLSDLQVCIYIIACKKWFVTYELRITKQA